jgi:hypothetical protein
MLEPLMPIRRQAEGRIQLELQAEERTLLRHVVRELRALLTDEPDDPSLRRLFPRTHEDEALELEYRELTRGQLASGRDRALATLEETAGRESLSAEEADAWLRALNDARLVLGTRLDVTEDLDWDEVGPAHPQAQELALYAYLSWMQEQLVEALA